MFTTVIIAKTGGLATATQGNPGPYEPIEVVYDVVDIYLCPGTYPLDCGGSPPAFPEGEDLLAMN